GRRPAWLIRLGLFLYDTLGGRKILLGTRTVDLTTDPVGAPLKDKFTRAFEYSDCWVEDSRLVVLNARDAQDRGARIATRTKVTAAERQGALWQVLLQDQDTGTISTAYARAMVNAAGPWVAEVIQGALRINAREGVRLVRGSHIVTKRLYDHDKCYFFQGEDGRIIFAIPYETDFTLIGTTDQDHPDPGTAPVCTDEEAEYLCAFASKYFDTPIGLRDVVWRYSGVRPLYDDGASSATAATRDYVLSRDTGSGAPLLNIFGGKITTYRRLAEEAVEKVLPDQGPAWTHDAPLPGGAFPVEGVEGLITSLRQSHPFLDPAWARRLVRAYGTEAAEILGDAKTAEDLGPHFGANLTGAEVDWLVAREFARSATDILWRRSKLGLRIDAAGRTALEAYLRDGDKTARA
ncbi:MAG: glycerol-3-phosphate dehydrogenase, partial [Pseudomonadota bacterium]